MPWLQRYKQIALPLALIILPEGCFVFTPDFIIQPVNSFTSKMSIALQGYQFDPLLNLSDPLFKFKLMSDFKLIKTESDFILSKSLTISDVPMVSFMQMLEETTNKYNKSFPILLIIIITIYSTLDASPSSFHTSDEGLTRNVISVLHDPRRSQQSIALP